MKEKSEVSRDVPIRSRLLPLGGRGKIVSDSRFSLFPPPGERLQSGSVTRVGAAAVCPEVWEESANPTSQSDLDGSDPIGGGKFPLM